MGGGRWVGKYGEEWEDEGAMWGKIGQSNEEWEGKGGDEKTRWGETWWEKEEGVWGS